MSTSEMGRVEQLWPDLASLLFVPYTEKEYQRLVAVLDSLIDCIAEDEAHPLASLIDVIGVFSERYEDEHISTLL